MGGSRSLEQRIALRNRIENEKSHTCFRKDEPCASAHVRNAN